jgi:hypothetical protein
MRNGECAGNNKKASLIVLRLLGFELTFSQRVKKEMKNETLN